MGFRWELLAPDAPLLPALLPACQKVESCVAVTVRQVESATRCLLYPDTSICGLSSTLQAPSAASYCRLVIKEPAFQVYLRTGE